MKYFSASGVYFKDNLPVHTFLLFELGHYPSKAEIVEALKHQSGWQAGEDELSLTAYSELSTHAYEAYMKSEV